MTGVAAPIRALGLLFSAGLCVAYSAACGLADNDGALDVLSSSADGSVADAPRNPTYCSILSTGCAICIGTNQCLEEFGDCENDGACRPAREVVVECICEAQLSRGGDVRSCDSAFRTSGPFAVALSDCMTRGCIAECGLEPLRRDR